MQEVFEQQSLPALLKPLPLELNHEVQIIALQRPRRFVCLLGDDTAEHFLLLHREVPTKLVLLPQVNDLLLLLLLIHPNGGPQ
jgi:hypothetical protein